jgi:hypothetical protein
MRVLWLWLAIAPVTACAPHAAKGPAWPKLHATENDGGESLAPHAAREIEGPSRADELDEHPSVPAPAATPAQATATPTAATPSPPAQAGEPQVLEGEEVIIEVDD